MTADNKSTGERPPLDIDVAAALASLRSTSPQSNPPAQGGAAPGPGSDKNGQKATETATATALESGPIPGGRKEKFPVKMMEILSDDSYSDSVAWLPHGRSFVFVNPEKFTRDVLPKYFKGCKFSSFTRKLYRWGFRQISKGPDAESFFHKHFRRDKKNLCQMITCGREIRDGCPELHGGISAESLMKHEQTELREEMITLRNRQMREAVSVRQQQLLQEARLAGGLGGGLLLRDPLLRDPLLRDPLLADPLLHDPLLTPLEARMRLDREAALLGGYGPEASLPPMRGSLRGEAVAARSLADFERLDLLQERMNQLRRRQLEETLYLERAQELGRYDGYVASGGGGAGAVGRSDPNLALLRSRQALSRSPYGSTARLDAMQQHPSSSLGAGAGNVSIATGPASRKNSVDEQQQQSQPKPQTVSSQSPQYEPILPKRGAPPLAPKASSSWPPPLANQPTATDLDSQETVLRARSASAAAFEDAVKSVPEAETGGNMVAEGVIRRAIDALRRAY